MNHDKIFKNFLGEAETQNRIKLALELILNHTKPVSVILFGSAARAELTASSDIDVVIVFNTPQEMRPALRILSVQKASLPFSLDFLVIDKKTYLEKSESGGVYFDAHHTGVMLFEA